MAPSAPRPNPNPTSGCTTDGAQHKEQCRDHHHHRETQKGLAEYSSSAALSSSSSSSSSVATAATDAVRRSSNGDDCSPVGQQTCPCPEKESRGPLERTYSWKWVTFQYLRLIRFYNHTNYLIVVLGATTFHGTEPLSLGLFVDLFVLYLTFNVGLYGGIYTLNAVTDAEEDCKDFAKKDRPIPSGAVSIPGACVFVLILWTFGFAGAAYYFRSLRLILYFLSFIFVNLVYSMVLKHVKFLRFTSAALTTPMRLYMGGWLRGTSIPFMGALIGYCFMASVQSTKVRREKKKELETVNGWPPFYLEALCMVTIGFGCVTMYADHKVFVYPVIVAVVLFLGGATLSRDLASILLGADIKANYTVVDIPVPKNPKQAIR